jgi:hypothetical protein
MFAWRKTAAKKTSSAASAQMGKPVERPTSKHAHAEIHAYLAIRDRLLVEAEENPNNSTLHRAWIANDVVEIFLKPARTPYDAQYLPEEEARVERKVCTVARTRIDELREKIATPTAGTQISKSGKPGFFGAKAIGPRQA